MLVKETVLQLEMMLLRNVPRWSLCHNVLAVSRNTEQSVRGNMMSEAIS
jgi:hypothetical protein